MADIKDIPFFLRSRSFTAIPAGNIGYQSLGPFPPQALRIKQLQIFLTSSAVSLPRVSIALGARPATTAAQFAANRSLMFYDEAFISTQVTYYPGYYSRYFNIEHVPELATAFLNVRVLNATGTQDLLGFITPYVKFLKKIEKTYGY